MKRVLICGARDWDDVWPIGTVIGALVERWGATNIIVIEGGAPGADTLAGGYAMVLGVHVAEVNALWKFYGKSAGPRRNGVMKALGPQLAFAFHRDITTSRGTANMVDQLRKASVPTVIVPDRVKALKVAHKLTRSTT